MELDLFTEVVFKSLDNFYGDLDFLSFIIHHVIDINYIKLVSENKVKTVLTWLNKRRFAWLDISRSKPVSFKCEQCHKHLKIPEHGSISNAISTNESRYEESDIICELNNDDGFEIRIQGKRSIDKIGLKSSTPIIDSEKQTLTADLKIMQLGTEVDALRKQIAQLNLRLCQNSTSSALPSAPPPPPPLPPIETARSAFSMDRMKDQIKKNKARRSSTFGCKEFETSYSMRTSTPLTSLADILKGAKNVKLRKVARSPGGTPIRPKVVDNGTDLTAILTRAMKRRFDKINPCNSPETCSENSFQSSSPDISFGKQRRKSSRKLTLSPLKEHNS